MLDQRPVTPGAKPQPRKRKPAATQRLARLSALHPWRTLAAWTLLFLASAGLIATMLGSALTSDASITSRPDSVRADELVEANMPQSGVIDEVVVVRSEQLTTGDAEFRALVTQLRSDLEGTGATRAVGDPYASQGGPAIAEDDHAVAVTLQMGADPEDGIGEVLEVVDDVDPPFDVAITGTFTLDHDFNELSESDLKNGELQFGLPAALIVLLLVFGAVVAAMLPMSIAVVSIVVAVAASAVVGQVTPLSFFIVNMITAMGLALGIDYSLFVLSRYREQRQLGQDKIEALVTTGGTASKAVLFSGTSFVVALFGLLLVPDTILRSLALGAIIVGLITMLAALTLLPALISLFGERVNALRLPFFGREHSAESAFWTRSVKAVVHHPRTALVAGVLVLLAMAAPVLDLRTGTAGVSSLPDSSAAKAGYLAVEDSFPREAGSDPAEIVVAGDVASESISAGIRDLRASLEEDADFGGARVAVAPDGDVAVISVPLLGDPDHTRARAAVETLRSELVPAAFEGTDAEVYVGGTTAENTDYSDMIARWLPIVLTFVLGLSLLLLTVVFRSIVLSATAIVLNLLSVGAAYGLLVLVCQKGWGAEVLGLQQVERVEAWVPIFLFSVLFALSMDYHVFLVTRIRERHAVSGDTVDAVVHGIAATGRIITGAALIIVVVFAGFAAGELVMFQQMGFGVGVALLVDATLIRMVVVPATMTLLGRWNWYLPSWLEWLPELDVEGSAPPGAEAAPHLPAPRTPPPAPVHT